MRIAAQGLMLTPARSVMPVQNAGTPVEPGIERLRAWQLPPPVSQAVQEPETRTLGSTLSPDWWKEHEYLLQHG